MQVDDEGEYECYLRNDVGTGTRDAHALTVNCMTCKVILLFKAIIFILLLAAPIIEKNLKNEESVANNDDSFAIICAFRAKPAASVRWLWQNGSSLPSNIFSSSSETREESPYTVSTKHVLLELKFSMRLYRSRQALCHGTERALQLIDGSKAVACCAKRTITSENQCAAVSCTSRSSVSHF